MFISKLTKLGNMELTRGRYKLLDVYMTKPSLVGTVNSHYHVHVPLFSPLP